MHNEKDIYKQIYHYNTQYLGVSSYADSTVVKMQNNLINGGIFTQTRYRGEEFLINSRGNIRYIGNRVGASDFYDSGGLVTVSERKLGENLENAIILPKPQKIRASLSKVINNRRSVRKFAEGEMSLKDLSNILYYTCGVSGKEETTFENYSSLVFNLRNSPSGGGIYPISLYFYCNNIKEIEEGIYIYYPENHAIVKLVNKENITDINKYADFASIEVEKVNLIFMYVYDMFTNSRKYGDMAVAFALIESGEMAQNLALTSTALGYGVCDIGAYDKSLVENDLELDGLTKHIIHMTIVGHELED